MYHISIKIIVIFDIPAIMYTHTYIRMYLLTYLHVYIHIYTHYMHYMYAHTVHNVHIYVLVICNRWY